MLSDLSAESPSAPIRALVCGYAAQHRAEKLLVMLQAFVDDSIGPSGDRRLYLAAYVQTAETWARFSDDWAACLQAEPPIPYFKMAEAHSRRGPFHGMSVRKRNAKVFALARVIQKHGLWGMHSWVSTVEYERILKPVAPYPFGTPYYVLFYAVAFGVARLHQRLGVNVPCDFIFDQHDGLPGKVLPFWDLMGHGLDEGARQLIGGSPIFRDDKDVIALQAADLLAWHVRRESDGNYPREYDGIVDLITIQSAHYETAVSREYLEMMAAKFRSIPLAATLSSKAAFAQYTKALGEDWGAHFQPAQSPWHPA